MQGNDSSPRMTLRIPRATYQPLHGFFPQFNSEDLIKDSKDDYSIKNKPNRKISDFNRKLDDILNVYKNTQRAKSNNCSKDEGLQQEDLSFDNGTLIGIKSLKRKINLQNEASQPFQRHSSNTTLPSFEKVQKKLNLTTSFPFLELRKTLSTNFSTPNDSSMKNARSTNLSIFHSTKSRPESISYTAEINFEEKKNDPSHVVKSSARKSPRSEEPKPKAKSVPKKLSKPTRRKATDFIQNPLSCFKPIKSNYAITVRNQPDYDQPRESSNPQSPQENNTHINGVSPNKLLISDIAPPNIQSLPKEKGQSIMKMFKNLDEQYSLSELGFKDTPRSTRQDKEEFSIISPQSVRSKKVRLDQIFPCKQPKKDVAPSPKPKSLDTNYREIIVMHSDFMRQGNLLVGTVLIPKQENFSSVEEAQTDFQAFLKSTEEKLLCPTVLRYAYLVNGETITHLNEIPPNCNLLLVNHSIFYQFRSKYLEYHSMKTISEEKWNLILFLLNKQTDENKTRYLLTNEKFNKGIIRNNRLDFSNLFEKNDVLHIKKKVLIEERKYESQIEEAINAIQNLYNQNKPGKPLNHEFIMEEYNKALKKINEELHKSEDSSSQKKAVVLEKMFNEFDIFLKNKEQNALYINCLDDLLNGTYSHRRNESVDKLLIENTQTKESKDFVKKNTRITGSETMRVYNAVSLQHRPLYEQNIPKLQTDSAFTRRELYKLYTKYKAVCAAFGFKKEFQNKNFDPRIGFDKDIFTKNFTQFQTATDAMISRIFTFGSEEEGQGMTWPKFLRLMMSVRAKSVKDKMALFLFLMDTDGSGTLSFMEVKAVCKSALDCIKSEDDHLIDSLADYFAKIVFEAVETNKDAEISLNKLKEIVEKGLEAADMLLAFAGAKQIQDEEIILESNSLQNKMPKIRLKEQHLRSNFKL